MHSDQGSSFMSAKVKQFMDDFNITSTRTTPYNPQGNGQCEKFNGTIWKAVKAHMEDNKWSSGLWEEALPHALNSIRSLVNSATGMTPHDRLFNFSRNSSRYLSNNMPEWIDKPRPILLKNFTRSSKNDPLVHEVELLDSKPHYAWVNPINANVW